MVHVFLPNGQRYWADEEREFFSMNTPLPEYEVLKVLAALYHGVVPAFAAADLRLLKESIEEIQGVGFKRREVAGQPQAVRDLLLGLGSQFGVPAGMSSMGPVVYAITDATSEPLTGFARSWARAGAGQFLGTFAGRNVGHESAGCDE